MKTKLTKSEQKLLKEIESLSFEEIKQHRMLWCYLDGKRHNCETFEERLELSKK